MKKVLLFCIALCLNFAVNAQRSEVTVSAGNAGVMMTNATACVEFDYNNTQVGEFPAVSNKKDVEKIGNLQSLDAYLKSRGDDFVRDWPQDHLKAESMFNYEMARLTKKGGFNFDLSNPYDQNGKDYKVRVIVDKLDMGNGAGLFIHNPYSFKTKNGGAIFQGTVEVINLKTGMAECVFDCPFVKGSPNPSETGRLKLMYMNLGQNIISLVKKGASNGGAVAASQSKPEQKETPAQSTQPQNPVNQTQNKNVFTVSRIVPQNFDLEDNMIIKNSSQYIINSVIVFENGNKITDCQNLAPGDERTVMKFSNDALSRFRGSNLQFQIESGEAKSSGAQFDVQYKEKHDDLIIEVISSGRYAENGKSKNSSSDKDNSGDKGFRMCFDYMHGFWDDNRNSDQLAFLFGANVIQGLYVGVGPLFNGGYGNGMDFSCAAGGDFKVRYTAPYWNVRPYIEYDFRYIYNFDSEKGGIENGIGFGVCFAKKVFLGIQYSFFNQDVVEVKTKKVPYSYTVGSGRNRRTYTDYKTEHYTETHEELKNYFGIRFGLMF